MDGQTEKTLKLEMKRALYIWIRTLENPIFQNNKRNTFEIKDKFHLNEQNIKAYKMKFCVLFGR